MALNPSMSAASPISSSQTTLYKQDRIPADRIILAIAAGNFLFTLLTSARYGFFIDEFYYYACSEHLQWGYVDHPPLVAGLMWIATHLFGTSLLGIRVLPSLLAGLMVWCVAATARALGGNRFAQVIAALSVIVAPAYMQVFHFFSMNAVEPVLWTACTLCVIRAIKRDNPHYWIYFGLLCGVGMENKYSIAILIGGIFLGLLLTPARSAFLNVYFWIGMLLALLVFLPNFLWLSHHDYPFLQWRSVMEERKEIIRIPAWRFLQQELLWTGSASLVWIAGLCYFLFNRRARLFRFAGISSLFVIAALIVIHGKSPYAIPTFGVLFAGGAVLLEGAIQSRQWLKKLSIAALLIPGAILAPCFVPILPLDRVVTYQSHIPLPLPIQTEGYALNEKFPQFFSLETGWEEMVAAVATVYHHLPPDQQTNATILTFHYGTAGAIDLLGPKYGLPKPISTAMTWHMWGPQDHRGDTIILVGYLFPPAYCKSYEEGPRLSAPYMYDDVGLK